jgi:hypothetical protein
MIGRLAVCFLHDSPAQPAERRGGQSKKAPPERFRPDPAFPRRATAVPPRSGAALLKALDVIQRRALSGPWSSAANTTAHDTGDDIDDHADVDA